MMIHSVTLDLSPAMRSAIDEHREEPGIQTAWANYGFPGDQGVCQLEITAGMAADWCEKWFSDEDLKMLMLKGEWLMTYPEICSDPMINNFMQTVLQIYRLTYTG